MSVVSRPVPGHHCGPNEYGYWMARMWDTPGTVWECDCGRTWVARRSDNPGIMCRQWGRESRLARWWRERRSA